MGGKVDREKNTWSCTCGSCGWCLGPYQSEEKLRKKMVNWSYAFVDDMGNSRCPECIQAAFDAQEDLKRYMEFQTRDK